VFELVLLTGTISAFQSHHREAGCSLGHTGGGGLRGNLLVHLHAVAFHPAAPVFVTGAVLCGFEDGLCHRPLQGLADRRVRVQAEGLGWW